MHRGLGVLLAVLAGMAAAVPAQGAAAWRASRLPGGPAFTLAAVPGAPAAVDAFVGRHVYRSADGGRTWSVAGRAFASPGTLVRSRDGSALLYSRGAGPTYRSTDNGGHWAKIVISGCNLVLVRSMDPVPGGPYAVDPCHGRLYRADAAAATWRHIHAPRGLTATAEITRAPGTPRNMALTDSGRAWWSATGGRSWHRVAGADLVSPVFNGPAMVWARGTIGNGASGLYRSTDGGRHWSHVAGPGSNPLIVGMQAGLLAVVYGGGGPSLALWGPESGQWHRIATGLPPPAYTTIPHVVFVSDALVYGAVAGPVRIPLDGSGWQLAASGTGDGWLLGAMPLTTATGVALTLSGLAYTADAGHTWNLSTGPPAGARLAILGTNGAAVVYAVGADHRVWRSDDSGATFAAQGALTGVPVAGAVSADGATVYAVVSQRLYRSDDSGRTFVKTSSARIADDGLAVDPADAHHVWTCAGHSIDGGHTWTGKLPVCSQIVDAGGTLDLVSAASGFVYSTANEGQTFHQAVQIDCDRVAWSPGIGLIAALPDLGLSASIDGGDTWRQLPPAPGANMCGVQAAGTTAYLAEGVGLYVLDAA
jgi:photosystem II stability/assembly factor-like uncharacterized protein